MKYNKGDVFLDKNALKLFIFDGNEWLEIVPTYKLKNCNLML